MNKYVKIVIDTLIEIGEQENNKALLEVNEKTKLFGANGVLDSVGIVFLIAELEENIDEEFDIQVSLADEKAMSRATSPFRNVEALAKYIQEIVEE